MHRTCSVTLGDDEARRRGAQKTVRERGSAPTFTACIEMLELQRWRVHSDVAPAVDRLLQGGSHKFRSLHGAGGVQRHQLPRLCAELLHNKALCASP